MNHLIQPIEIEGVTLCPTQMDGRMTTSILTETQIVDGSNFAFISSPVTADLVHLVARGIGSVILVLEQEENGEISFGVVCGDTVTIDLTLSDSSISPDFSVEVSIYLNGVLEGAVISLNQGSPATTRITVNLSDNPCGNTLTLVALAQRTRTYPDNEGDFFIKSEIISIT